MNDLAKILGIYDAKVKLKSINDHTISFYIYTDTKPHLCPHCNLYTSKVHDYRMQKIKDIPLHNKSCILFLNKRRYHCSGCGKHFYESYDFVSRYLHRTQRLTKFIAHSFYDLINIKHASIRANISTHTVYKVLGTLNNSSDRYHFIRQVYWALENVRKNVQKNMSKTLRRYY
ncbi:transposase family ISL3 helix-turn-helix domain protein, partial [Lachnoanaerobaculum saburreum F0468]